MISDGDGIKLSLMTCPELVGTKQLDGCHKSIDNLMANPAEGGVITNELMFVTVSITATPNDDFLFQNWILEMHLERIWKHLLLWIQIKLLLILKKNFSVK